MWHRRGVRYLKEAIRKKGILSHMIWLDEGGRQRGLRLIVPPPALRDQVEHFWIQETMPKTIWRIVPIQPIPVLSKEGRARSARGGLFKVPRSAPYRCPRSAHY